MAPKAYGLGRVYRRHRTWWIEYWDHGKRRRESAKSSDRDVALNLLRERQLTSAQGQRLDLTVEDLATLVRRDYQINGRKSTPPWARILEHFGRKTRAVDITTAALTRYVERRLADGAKPQTVKNEVAALGRGFTLARKAGHLTRRPEIPTIQIRNTRSGFFEDKEFRAILRQLPEHLRPVAEFAYLTGWRRAEILGLEWRQVDFKAGTIRLEPGTTKNEQGRTFPFRAFPRLAALLEHRRIVTTTLERGRGQVIPWVFTLDGRPMRGWYYDAWRAACNRAGLPGRLVHDFRRTVVRNLERAGVPRSVAMQLTGHKTESVYRRYAIVSEADLAAGVRKLARLYGSQTDTLTAQVSGARPWQMRTELASPTGFEPVLPP